METLSAKAIAGENPERGPVLMEKFLQVIMVLCLLAIGISAVLSIRAHFLVWMYAPPMERLPRGPQAPESPA